MLMPKPEAGILAQRSDLLTDLRAIVPGEGVIADEVALRAYESDGLSAYRQVPMAVVLPETVEQVAAIMQLCDRRRIKVVPRGAGTSLSGGALPLEDGIILGLGKFNRVLEIDYENRAVR
ncbi:MAG: FAD-binding protein, partial [Rhodospirillaceae bacterium]|nr:FAD-binding protein [Rhodospirillaceae bacterium]